MDMGYRRLRLRVLCIICMVLVFWRLHMIGVVGRDYSLRSTEMLIGGVVVVVVVGT